MTKIEGKIIIRKDKDKERCSDTEERRPAACVSGLEGSKRAGTCVRCGS
jgi:hypothetical protein